MKESRPIKQPGRVATPLLLFLALILCPQIQAAAAQSTLASEQLPEQRPGQLDVAQAVHRAVSWHPSVAEAGGRVQEQMQEVRAAKAGYFPQVNVSANSGYDSSDDPEEDFGIGDNQALTLSASQMLYDFGKVSSSIDAASAGVERRRAQALAAIDRVARDTARAAIEMQRFQANLAISRQQVQGVDAIAELARKRRDKGASTRSDVLQAQSRVEDAKASEQRVRAQLNRWRSALGNLTGGHAPGAISADFPANLAQSCSMPEVDRNSVPGVISAEAVRAQAEAEIDLSRANSLPTLSVDGNLNHYLDDRYRTPGSGINEQDDYGVFLNVSMPLYQGGAAFARRDAAAYALKAAEAARDAALLEANLSLREAQEQNNGLALIMTTLDMRVRSIAETRDLYREQYLSLGTRSLLDLLNAEQELYRARIERSDNLHELRLLQIECLFAAGALRSAFQLDSSRVQGEEVQS